MQLPETTLTFLQARLRMIAEMREITRNPKWKTAGFRYDLGALIKVTHPERVDPDLIPMSRAASTQLIGQQSWVNCQKSKLTYEHAVPLGILHDLLMEVREEPQAINDLLSDLFFTKWVTKEEDKLLNASGLRQKMPAGWTRKQGPWARYEYVDIH